MRLLSILGVWCLLSNSVFGVHEYEDIIQRSYSEAERTVEALCSKPEELKGILDSISEMTVDNFFLVLNICACSIARNYKGLLDVCVRKFQEAKPSVVGACWTSSNINTCLYYFEEMFCKGNEHRLNFIALYYLRTRVEAMLLFLQKSRSLPGKTKEKEKVIAIYRQCIQEYETDSSLYERLYTERLRSEWTFATQPEWTSE